MWASQILVSSRERWTICLTCNMFLTGVEGVSLGWEMWQESFRPERHDRSDEWRVIS
jgi:hypothetical protein